MKIDVYTSHLNIGDQHFDGKIAVMVDVLRASTSIITALYNGCTMVIPEEEISEAVDTASRLDRDLYLLAGERHGVMIDGFDLGNSPSDYDAETVTGKIIFLTTSNGTRTIKKAVTADKVYVGGFVNLDALVEILIKHDKDIAILCAGTNGCFSLEDILFAGALIKKLKDSGVVAELNDLGIASYSLYESSRNNLDAALSDTVHYKRLYNLGFYDDIKDCLSIDTLPVVPIYKDGEIVLEFE